MTKSLSCSDDDTLQKLQEPPKPTENIIIKQKSVDVVTTEETNNESDTQISIVNEIKIVEPTIAIINDPQIPVKMSPKLPDEDNPEPTKVSDAAISLVQYQNTALLELKDSLLSQIAAEKSEIVLLKYCIANNSQQQHVIPNTYSTNIDKLDELMNLISKENKTLQIKKTDLVREIMEQREACIYLQSKLAILSSNVR